MAAANMPRPDYRIDTELARALLADQQPELASMAIVPLGFGWDNVVFRLGSALTMRLPRRSLAVPLLEHELRWLPILGPRLPLPVPVPVYAGRPALGYPSPWCVSPYFPGAVAAQTPPSDLAAAAGTLGIFLSALHRPAPPEAPHNPQRGIPLAMRAASVAEHLDRSRVTLGARAHAELAARWRGLSASAPWEGPPVWLHGDLHPANIVVHEGALAAVIDFGDLCAGDPATDLAIAWMMFPRAQRDLLRRATCARDDLATWQRAQAWALALGLAALANSADHPVVAEMGRRTLRQVLAEAAHG